MGIKITGDKRVLLARNTPARRDLDEQFRSLSDVVLGRQNTHPALPLLLPALDLQLLLVLPVGKKEWLTGQTACFIDRYGSISCAGLLVLIDFSSPFFVSSLPQRCFFGLSVFPLSLQLLALLLRLATLLQPTSLLFFLEITTGWRR